MAYWIGFDPSTVTRPVNQSRTTRRYHAPRRTAAAAETRRAILRAAKEEFEAHGWAAATMRSIAASAGVSPKTVEALFATKAALLEATLLLAFGGEAWTERSALATLRPDSVLLLRPQATREIERATDAATMLERHSALLSEIQVRSARISWAAESAVTSDERLAQTWGRLNDAYRFGAHWSAEVLLQKPGVRPDLTLREAEETFVVASDWHTYRTLTTRAGLTPDEVQAWITNYYRRMLLA
jgi:AcrR family transcriptional regulator